MSTTFSGFFRAASRRPACAFTRGATLLTTALVAILGIAACGPASEPIPALGDAGLFHDHVSAADVTPVEAVAEDVPAEVAADVAVETVDPCEASPLGLGCPCKKDAECEATALCVKGADKESRCAAAWSTACRPCREDAECVIEGLPDGDQALCASLGNAGSFCLPRCKSGKCADEWSCAELSEGGKACSPDANVCDCNDAAKKAGASTDCVVVNEHGGCPGVATCREDGLSACEGTAAAPETCGAGDENCDGQTDETGAEGCTTYYRDGDNDGAGAMNDSACLCAADNAYPVTVGGDCDDTDAQRHPGQLESCNGIDDDCDGSTDPEGASGCTPYHADADGDGYGTGEPRCLCAPLDGYAATPGDCDDTNAAVNPGASESCLTPADDDCDGLYDTPNAVGCIVFYQDADSDGWGGPFGECLCAPSGDYVVATTGDCDDSNNTVNPAAIEACNGLDDNCDDTIDPADSPGCKSFFADGDGDGFGTGALKCLCGGTVVFSASVDGDCDDTNAKVNPAALENCATATLDDDCDGQLDAVGAAACTTYYYDGDADGFGTSDSECRCVAKAGYRAIATGDCDDGNADIHPGSKVCGKDGDCDGRLADAGEACDDGNAEAMDGCLACVVQEFRVNEGLVGDQSVALSGHAIGLLPDGRFLVAWSGASAENATPLVRVRAFLADGTPATGDVVVGADATSSVAAEWPSIVTFADGTATVFWTTTGEGTGKDVVGQRLGADLTAVGGPFALAKTTAGNQGEAIPVALPDGGFLAVWSGESKDAEGYGICKQAFLADGTMNGLEIQVNTTAKGDQVRPAAALLDGGGHVIVWGGPTAGNGSLDIFGQRYKADGTKVGGEFTVNSLSNGDQKDPAVAALGGGGFVVVWSSAGTQDTGSDVRAQRFKADGTRMGSEFLAGTQTYGDQVRPAVQGLAGGAFVVVWNTNQLAGSGWDLYAQRFKSSATVDGAAFLVNALMAGDQMDASSALFADGRAILVWTGYDPLYSKDVFAQRFDSGWKKIYR